MSVFVKIHREHILSPHHVVRIPTKSTTGPEVVQTLIILHDHTPSSHLERLAYSTMAFEYYDRCFSAHPFLFSYSFPLSSLFLHRNYHEHTIHPGACRLQWKMTGDLACIALNASAYGSLPGLPLKVCPMRPLALIIDALSSIRSAT